MPQLSTAARHSAAERVRRTRRERRDQEIAFVREIDNHMLDIQASFALMTQMLNKLAELRALDTGETLPIMPTSWYRLLRDVSSQSATVRRDFVDMVMNHQELRNT